MRKIQLYIHIPFCAKKCAYCDFLSFSSSEDERELYLDALIKEIESHKDFGKTCEVSTIFIGGGTPSILSDSQMKRLLESVKNNFFILEDVEFSIEVNPGSVTKEKLKEYNALGINRVSIGLQATNNEELKKLGRIHTMEEFLSTYELVKKVGINNINIDLISAIPKQTIATWTQTLKDVIRLEPTHISAYSLIIEEGTRFYEEKEKLEDQLPSEDEERAMYELTKEILSKAGYIRYEISNYAKKGYECRHNLGYWERKEYLGLGLGAASLLGEIRIKNEDNLKKYIEKCNKGNSVQVEREEVTKEEQIEEFLFLGLRKMNGISKKEFNQRFDISIEEVYGKELQEMLRDDWLREKGDILQLTDRGIDISNQIFANLLIKEVKD